jgi:hypothetical protein
MSLVRFGLIVFMAVGKTAELFIIFRLVMTGGAILPLARMGSGKNRKVRVVLLIARRLPGKKRMAFVATAGKSNVTMDGCPGALEIRGVTGVTLRRQNEKFAFDFTSVARFTVQSAVRAQEGKCGLLMHALFVEYLPTFRRMATIAGMSQPALMNIQMAVHARRRCLFKIAQVVAEWTRDLAMMTDQGKIGRVVIEFYGLPPVFIVALLTGLLDALVGHGLRPTALSVR